MLAALDSRGDAVFALDMNRRPIAMTEPAEAMLRQGEHLNLRWGSLRACDAHSERALADAFGQAVGFVGGGRTAACVVLRHSNEAKPALVARIGPVPDRVGPFSSTCALLIVASATGEDDAAGRTLLADLFGFTPAEAAVAIAIAAGLSPKQIAADRRLSPATIRTQLRSAMAKAGVKRQSALVAIVAAARR